MRHYRGRRSVRHLKWECSHTLGRVQPGLNFHTPRRHSRGNMNFLSISLIDVICPMKNDIRIVAILHLKNDPCFFINIPYPFLLLKPTSLYIYIEYIDLLSQGPRLNLFSEVWLVSIAALAPSIHLTLKFTDQCHLNVAILYLSVGDP